MLKVIVTGAYSTGKTGLVDTLHFALTSSNRTVVRVPDVARQCPVPLNTEQNANATLWLIATQISREIEAGQGSEDVMLCDRGVPDVLAHDLDLNLDLANGERSWIPLLNPLLKQWMLTYDLLLLARVDEQTPIATDGVRVEDAAYRTRLDHCAVSVLAGTLGVEELPLGGPERVAYALAAVERALEAAESAANT